MITVEVSHRRLQTECSTLRSYEPDDLAEVFEAAGQFQERMESDYGSFLRQFRFVAF